MFRVNLVDRDVDMQVIGIAMDHADALMSAEPELGAKTLLDCFKGLCVRMFAGAEGNEQVIGPVRLCPGIEPLGGSNFAQRQRKLGRNTIGDSYLPHPGVLALGIDEIGDEFAKTAFLRALHTDLLGNHRASMRSFIFFWSALISLSVLSSLICATCALADWELSLLVSHILTTPPSRPRSALILRRSSMARWSTVDWIGSARPRARRYREMLIE